MVAIAFPFVGCGGSPLNSFEIIRDQQKQSYDSTRITLKEEDSQLVLLAWNTRDPIPNAADDEYSDGLRVVFEKDALEELDTDQDEPISGEGSWTSISGTRPSEVTFTPPGCIPQPWSTCSSLANVSAASMRTTGPALRPFRGP
jgi:hypothetical protein